MESPWVCAYFRDLLAPHMAVSKGLFEAFRGTHRLVADFREEKMNPFIILEKRSNETFLHVARIVNSFSIPNKQPRRSPASSPAAMQFVVL